MEHDIRDLFKNETNTKKKIPKNNREEFITKLAVLNPKKRTKKLAILKIAASILLLFSCIYLYQKENLKVEKSAFEIQVEKIEKDYINNIDKEWKGFLAIAKDTVLIQKYEVKLKESDTEYSRITKQLKKNPNNVNILESLIENLQRRLQLIKDIKEHMKELNQKNKSNETIYL
jgi:hypothetical protein